MKRPNNNNNSEHFIKETELAISLPPQKKLIRLCGNMIIDLQETSKLIMKHGLNWIVKPQPRE